MPKYTFNGKTYNIPDEKVDSFLTKNLSAEPLNINSFNDVDTTQETEKKQQQDVVAQQAITKDNPNNMVFEDLPEQYGLSNTNQGSFGYQTSYFTPRPLQPELNIEEYDIDAKEKEYKIDTEKEEEKARKRLGLNQSELLDNMETLPPSKKEITAINDEGNLLFPTDKDGKYSVSNLNPEGLITQENLDFQAEMSLDIASRSTPGGFLLKQFKDFFAPIVSKAVEFGENTFGDGEIGGKKILDEKSQGQISNQIKFLKQAEQQLQAQLKKGDITKEEANDPNSVAKLAKSLYVNDKELDIYRKNLTKFLDEDVDKSWFNLAKPELQKRLEKLYGVHKSNFDKATKDSLEITETTSIALEAISKDFDKLKEQVKKGEISSEDYVKKIEDLSKKQNKNLDLALRASADLNFLVKDEDQIKAYGDLIGRNYNGIVSNVAKASYMASDLLVNASYYAQKLDPKVILKEVILPIANSKYPDSDNQILLAANNAMKVNDAIFKNTGVDFFGSKDTDAIRNSYDKIIKTQRDKLEYSTNYSDIKDFNSFGKWAFGFMAEQTPQLALMVFAPQIALPMLGASAGGAKFNDMRMQNFRGDKNFSTAQMYGTSMFTAIAEVGSEKMTMNLLGRLKVQNMPVNGVKKSFTQSIKDNLFNANRWKATGFDLNQEGLSEVYAKIGENIADKYIGGSDDVGIYDGVDEAYVSGVFMAGTIFKAPAIGNKILAPFKTKDLNLAFDKNVNSINQLTSQLSNTSNARTVDVINNKINELVIANSNIRVDQAMSTDYLAQEQKNELLNIYKSEAQNNKDINVIKNDNSLDPAAKSEIINGLEVENSKLSEQRENIMAPAIEANYNETTQNVKDIVENIDGVTIKEVDDVKAENLARGKRNNEKMSLAETDGKKIDPAELEDIIDETKPGTFNTKTGEIIINKAAALKNKQVNVAAHELLHGIMAQTFKGNPAAQKSFGESVLKELNKIPGINQTKFASRITQYQGAVEAGEISKEDAYEEAMNLLGDAIATKDIKLPETVLTKIGKFITDLVGKAVPSWKTKFNKGSDVVSFIKNFQKEVSEGELSDQTLNVAKEGAKGKLTKPATKAKPTTKASLPTVKGVDATQVKDMVGKVANRAVAKYYRGIPRNIREKAGLDRATYLDSARTELIEIAQKYDSTKKDKDGNQVSFDRYMANTGMQRLNALATKLGVESSEQGVTQSLDSPQAQQVADTTAEIDTTPDTKPIIDVMNFAKKADSSIDVKKFEQDFTDGVNKLAESKGIDITSPNLTPKQLQAITPYDVLAKAIGIPANKLSNAADNLSKSESLKAQRILLAAKPFIKNVVLGQANKQVQTVASQKKGGKPVKVGGESLGLGRNILNTFFNPPKRVGNNYVRTPKKFDNKIYDAAIGTQNGKVDPNYVPRASESQTIKGLLKGVAEQMANRGARNILDTKTQTSNVVSAKANLERGKSPLMFSLGNENTTLGQAERLIINKNTRFNYTSNIGEFINTVVATNKVAEAFEKVYGQYNIPIKAKDALIQSWKNINIQARLKEVEMDLGNPLKINQQKYLYESFAESQNQVIRDVLGISKDGLNYSDINQMEGMNNTLMEVVNSYRENGKSEAEIYKTIYTMASNFTGNSKIGNGTLTWNKQKNGDWKLVKNKKEKGAQRYDLYTNANEMMSVLGLKKPKGFKPEAKVGQSKDAYIRDLRKNDNNLSDKILNKSADYAKTNKDAFFDLLDWYKSLPAKQKAMHKNGMGMVLASSYRGTSTLIRESAPVNSIAETDFSEGFGQYRYEHNPPARVMAIYSAEYLTDNKTKKQLQTEFDNFGVTIIPLSMDAVLDENYQSTIPLGAYGRFGRYYNPKNFGKFPFVTKLYSKKNNKWDTRTYGDLAPVAFEMREADQKIDNTIKKGQDAYAKDPNLKPSLPDPAQLNADINNIISDTKNIDARKRFSDIVAKRRGAGVKNFKLISAGAQDFSGLMYDLYGKGKKGETQQKWVKDNLVKPYQDGIANIDKYRQALKNDYATLLKKFPEVTKKLGKIAPGTEFTFDQALRVNLWTQGGFEIPGLSKRDIKKLNDVVNKDPELKLFNDSALAITKQPKWVAPSPHWDVESLISDLNSLTTKVGRKEYLAEFIENANTIFSKENLNKMEVALGTNWREAMEDSLYRMINGTNRPSGTNKLTNDFLNWVNNSVGAIMFMNVKSALLQTISSVNFLNWSDNNPFKAGLALANFPQYVKDFSFLWNSPKLVQRRSGLRKDINEAELANAAQGAKNKPAAMLSYLLKLGFTPTQVADSFAIASGGATFYRNRLNTYKKQGFSEAEASDKAFEDFAEASDVAQQSSDPMLISQQQASVLGRLLLAFQNTPAQVTRIFNKASRDFINGRGDQKTNISKMIYYGAVQGFIFAALQNAAFALIPGFDEEEDEEKKAREYNKKEERILNSMVDTMLRGSGVYGAIVATLKNTALTYYREEKKDAFGRDHRNTLLEILNLSPPIGSKVRKINNAIKAKDYNKEVVKEQGWDVTLKGKVNLSPSYQVIASLTEAITNLPLERAVVEIGRIVEMLDSRNTTFQRVALALGYRTWDVNVKNEERDLVKIESKQAKEKARKQKVIDDRAERARLKEIEKYKGKSSEEIKQIKRRDSIVDTNKSDQIKSLINLGLTKKQIKELKYENDRVNKIIELTNK